MVYNACILNIRPPPEQAAMPDAFSDLSRRILDLAHIEAIRLDHAEVGPAHLLIALLREPTNRPGELLRKLKVSVDNVRMRLKHIEGDVHPEVHSYPIPRSARLEKVFASAITESHLAESSGLVEPEHLLAGLFREEQDTFVQIPRNEALDVKDILEDIGVAALKRRPPNNPITITITILDATFRKEHLERFSNQARKVMEVAGEEALRLQHGYIGTEHILLGIINSSRGMAGHVLRTLGIDLSTTRFEVEKLAGPTPAYRPSPDKLTYTPRVKEVIEFAVEEGQKLKHDRIETEHLLLGLLRMETGGARRVLGSLGLSPEHVRAEVLGQFREPG
jgi:ATP-dependent Clp protease ATP-binding subunit ClpA